MSENRKNRAAAGQEEDRPLIHPPRAELPPAAELTRPPGLEEAHFRQMRARTLELVDQAFDFFSIMPGRNAAVCGSSENPFIGLHE